MALRGTLVHRKTRRLATILGISPCFALGILEAIWHYAGAQKVPDGDLSKLSPKDLAEEIWYDGDGQKLFDALIESAWLDVLPEGVLYVHGWHEHADDAVKLRLGRATKRFANGAIPDLSLQDVSVHLEYRD